jgi:hypothetical protein
LTCAVEAALNALKSALDGLIATRDQTQAAFESAIKGSIDGANEVLATWTQKARAADSEAAKAAADGAQLAGEEKSRLTALHASLVQGTARSFTAPTPTPHAGTGRLASISSQALLTQTNQLLEDNSLAEMNSSLQREANAAKEKRGLADARANAAQKAIAASETASREAFAASFGTSIAAVIVLVKDGISNPVQAIAAVAALANALSALASEVQNELAPVLDREAQNRADLADSPHAAADDAAAHALRAREILAKMERAVKLQTVAARKVLAGETSFGPTPAPHPRLTIAANAQLAAFSKSIAPRLRSLHGHVASVTTVPADVTPFRAKVAAGFATQFQGKSQAAVASTRDALLAEARRRFGSDPKTLAGVEKLIADAARSH